MGFFKRGKNRIQIRMKAKLPNLLRAEKHLNSAIASIIKASKNEECRPQDAIPLQSVLTATKDAEWMLAEIRYQAQITNS